MLTLLTITLYMSMRYDYVMRSARDHDVLFLDIVRDKNDKICDSEMVNMPLGRCGRDHF